MIEEGVLENPKVDAAMAMHIWSLIPSGRVSITPGVVMGGLDVFKIRVQGRGGHTGAPQDAVDPVLAAANIINAVQTAREKGLLSVGLLGGDGGKLAGMVERPLVIPHRSTQRIQEEHIFIIHILVEMVESDLI